MATNSFLDHELSYKRHTYMETMGGKCLYCAINSSFNVSMFAMAS